MPTVTERREFEAATKLPAVLKTLHDVTVTSTFDVQFKEVTQKLAASGIASDVGTIAFAGRDSSGQGEVQFNTSTMGYSSSWPEWAYQIAESALHFNKQVWVIYKDKPFGTNLLTVLCMK